MPNFFFSDSYLNEWAVAIASDASSSKERSPYAVTQGGIMYWLRRLVAERAKTAREGVYVPWYLGILEIPKPYAVGEPADYDELPLEKRYYDPYSAYWVFNRMNTLVDMDYRVRQPLLRGVWDDLEATEFELQKEIEKTANKLYRGDKGKGGDQYLAQWFLTRYTESLALTVYYMALDFIEQFEN